MIGQTRLRNEIVALGSKFPRFSIIVGESGKRTLAEFIAETLKADYVICGISVDDVREIIEMSYQIQQPVVYVFPNVDKMSTGGKNALLKITEEPPASAYFILTVKNKENLMETLFSRGTVFELDPYSKEEIREFVMKSGLSIQGDLKLFYALCNNMQDAINLSGVNVDDLRDFAKNVATNVTSTQGKDIFGFITQLKLKETGTGFAPYYVFRTIQQYFAQKVKETKDLKYTKAVKVTGECLEDLAKSFNKLGTIDKWIFDVREVLK